MTRLIGLAGKAGAGKSECAKLLGMLGYVEHTFAEPLKEAAMVLFDWEYEHVYGELKDVVDPKYGFSPRTALQKLGTDYCRDMLRPDFHIIRAEKGLDALGNTCFSDVRFNDEAAAIIKRDGIIIEVIRNESDLRDVPKHKSEAGLSESLITYKLINNGGIADLLPKLKKILKDAE